VCFPDMFFLAYLRLAAKAYLSGCHNVPYSGGPRPYLKLLDKPEKNGVVKRKRAFCHRQRRRKKRFCINSRSRSRSKSPVERRSVAGSDSDGDEKKEKEESR
jgi:hypothetical protein